MEAPVNGGSNSNCPKRRKSAIVIRESRVEGLSLNGSKRRAAKLVWKNCCAAGNPSLYKFSDEEKVTILSCLVSAFSPPLFSPRLGRFFRFFNESLHESCNRIKDILSSRSVCLMPSIESIGAISSLGGRAIDSSCPWLVKGMSSGTIESLKLRNSRISQELNKLFYASGIGKHDKSVLHILASSLTRPHKTTGIEKEKGFTGSEGKPRERNHSIQFRSLASPVRLYHLNSFVEVLALLPPALYLHSEERAKALARMPGQERPSLKLREAIPLENRRCKSIQIDRGVPNQQQALSNVLGEGSAAEAKKSNQCSFRAQPKDPILAAAGALDGTGKTVHE
ncbi:hypothetical protein L1887_62072 [Cichorium endivia]|nr:hypothetical protein L1887_62072 [Cichorium endivia]